jgi:peptidoglycan-associated lipoprotein
MEIKKTYLLSIIVAVSLLAGCTSTDTASGGNSEAEAQAQAQAQAEAEAAAEAERLRIAAEQERKNAELAANLQTVFYFDFDQATLSASSRTDLDAQIAALKNSNDKVRLEGHTDERGTREYNIALGERRANAIANYLVVNGIPRYRIETVSYGEERPENTGNGESAWSQNRRVELR